MPPFRSPKPVTHPYPFVFCTSTCATGTRDGLTVHLYRNDVWASDDPVVLEHSHDGLFSDEPPQLIRSTPDPERLEAASAAGSFAEEVADADRNRPTSKLIAY
jgi:hypothetical protein